MMASTKQFVIRAISFTRIRGLQVAIGAGTALLYTLTTLEPLVERFGAIGGAMASLAGIGLGLLATIFASLFFQLAKAPASDAAKIAK